MVDVDRAPEPDDLRAHFINDEWTRTRRATQPADNAHDLAGAITANYRFKGDDHVTDIPTPAGFDAGGRVCYAVNLRQCDDGYGRLWDEEVRVATYPARAQVISSELHGSKMHKPVIDIDVPIRVYRSSTPGHSHLYIDKEMTWWQYRRLMRALVRAGLVEKGFHMMSGRRKGTHVRLPWVKK